MKSSLERSHLVHALSRVRSVVETRSTLPVLSHVHIKASEGKLTLTGTDIDIWIDETCEASVATEGSAVVKAQKLFDIARAMPEGSSIHLEVKNNALTLKSGAARFVLSSMTQEALPRREKLKETERFQIAAPDLLKMLVSTSFAISDDESRYYLNGVYLHAHQKENDDKTTTSTFRAVATDGHRLARIERQVDGTEKLPGVILPRKAAQELRKLLEDAEEKVEVDVKLFRQEEEKEKDGDLDNTRVTVMEFAFDKTTLTSRLIDGSFPDYERVIPKDNDKVMRFQCKEFSERVAAVHYMSSETTHGVKFDLKKGSLQISAHHGTDGEGNYPLDVEYDGEPIEVGYNALYLLAMTRDVIPGKAEFRWKDPETAAVVRNCDDDSVLYVLMPMRV